MTGRPSKCSDEIVEIYGLYHPVTDELRYIGKARNAAARLKSHMRDARRRNTPVYCWFKKLAQDGLVPVFRVLESGADWGEIERRLIAKARADGVRLLNIADGGDEPKCSPETRAKNGRATKDRLLDPVERKRWNDKRAIANGIRRGEVSNATRAVLRECAALSPKLFGDWAFIPDRIGDERGMVKIEARKGVFVEFPA